MKNKEIITITFDQKVTGFIVDTLPEALDIDNFMNNTMQVFTQISINAESMNIAIGTLSDDKNAYFDIKIDNKYQRAIYEALRIKYEGK